jgi:hypothetical protein
MARRLDWEFATREEQYPFTIIVRCVSHSRLGDLGFAEYRLDYEQDVHVFGDWVTWYEINDERPTGNAFMGFKTAEDATMAALLLDETA